MLPIWKVENLFQFTLWYMDLKCLTKNTSLKMIYFDLMDKVNIGKKTILKSYGDYPVMLIQPGRPNQNVLVNWGFKRSA